MSSHLLNVVKDYRSNLGEISGREIRSNQGNQGQRERQMAVGEE